jgi:hypothetical protein
MLIRLISAAARTCNFPTFLNGAQRYESMDALVQLGDRVSQRLGWPAWALWITVVLSLMIGALSLLQSLFSATSQESSPTTKSKRMTTEFRLFQFQYLSVYLTIMLADWLQGTNMYTLYSVSLAALCGGVFLFAMLTMFPLYCAVVRGKCRLSVSHGLPV